MCVCVCVFLCVYKRSGPVKPVYPDTVVEALEYVLGQRQHQEDEDTNNNTQ